MVATLEDNIKAYESKLSEMELHYLGKVVVFYDGEFIESFDNFNNAGEFATKTYGRGPYLIREVGAPTSYRMPTSIMYQPDYADH